MTDYIAKCARNVYCCYIAEVPVGVMVNRFQLENHSLRLYDGTGTKLDERLFKSRPFANCLTTSEYYGRKPDEYRFKQGDVVEYVGYLDKSHLGVVERAILEYDEEEAAPIGDDSDDGYLIWPAFEYADGNEYISKDDVRCTEVFTPHFPIPKKEQKRIDKIRRMIEERHSKLNKADEN